jgi:hypothetical protein
MTTEKKTLADLHAALTRRLRPEDTARLILAVHGNRVMPDAAGKQLRRVTRGSSYFSYMSREWAKPGAAASLEKKLRLLDTLFPKVWRYGDITAATPEQINLYLRAIGKSLHINGDFKSRLARKDRMKMKYKSHRAYNKRVRLYLRSVEKLTALAHQSLLAKLAHVAKVRLADSIPVEAITHRPTAYFITYFVARLGVRSAFTWGKQDRPYDQCADALLDWCKHSKGTNWQAIALVHPVPEVLMHLTDSEKGMLIGQWLTVMQHAAHVLGNLASTGAYDLERLKVRRGNDSSTWNEAAGAFNKARDGWLSCTYALGADSMLDRWCVGKAMRLMAADVMFLHRHIGSGDVEPDTKVWQKLPKPWDVFNGLAACPRGMIELACREAGVEGKGWITPRDKTVAEFRPTPELVYGVVVTNAPLARALKKAGYFAGPSKAKKVTKPVKVLTRRRINERVEISQ